MHQPGKLLEDDAIEPVLELRDPMVHQFDCVHRNEPTPQIMIQLVGCRIRNAPHTDRSADCFKVKS
jgi:hypothetical protein